ncbi:zinc finger MYM-type protein 5-like [Ylistrum balloti]|uniref:zinc finger MYM-type protein 5-like n=1 Tax=Ylistrum balloti TaxID=509963 RepID=UPI002905B110|nr:zinc finger MYM-type protein 5-like [Ylistrum balloti]
MAQRKITELFNVNRTCGSVVSQDNLGSENKKTSLSEIMSSDTSQDNSQPSEYKPPYSDINVMSENELKDDSVRRSLLATKWDTANKFNFPVRKIYGRDRKFNHSWLNDHSWMRYSVSDDSVFCACCLLFGDKADKTRLFVKPGVSDWVNLSMLVKRHECSEIHNNCKTRAQPRAPQLWQPLIMIAELRGKN